jgi:TolB-like protein
VKLLSVVILLVGLVTVGQIRALVENRGVRPLHIALLPFEDRAGFQGEWNLATDVPALLGKYLSDVASVHIIAMDTVVAVAKAEKLEDYEYTKNVVQIGRELSADIVIVGTIKRFGTRRRTAGDPNLINYKAYSSRIELTNVRLIRVANEKEVDSFDISDESEEKPLGLDLFGKPRQQDREFRELFKVEFGSERFFELQLGRLVDEVFEDLSKKITRALIERPPIDLSGETAKILSVDDDVVFLGIGSQNYVEYGDVLPVYDEEGAQMALVEVNEVLGSQMSRARVVERAGLIVVGSRLGQRVPQMELQSPGEKE